MKSSLLSIAFAAMLVSVGTHRSHAALVVVNGDFSDLSGNIDQGGGWYRGVPTGWATGNSSGAGTPTFSVWVSGSTSVPNLSQLSQVTPSFLPFYQDVGTTDAAGPVTLTFDILNIWQPATAFEVGAAIYGGNDQSILLANSGYTTTGTKTLQAASVAAGVPVRIAFWSSSGVPGLDNVVIVPEPSSAVLLLASVAGLGGFAAVRRRR